MWKGLKEITNYKTPSPSTVENQQLADDLNEFYCRFEKTPHTRSEHLSTQPLTPPATPLSPTPAIQFSEDEVCQVFWKQKRKKAPGPDCVTPVCLKSCADHHHTDLQQINGAVRRPFFSFIYTGTMHNKTVVPELAMKLICICSLWAGCCYKITKFNQKQYNTYIQHIQYITSNSIK